MSVIIETSIGDITVDLYTDERPRCCLNFLKLCKIKYYNFSLFHTIQENLVAQCGDPTATGRGGESIFGVLYGEQARFFDMEVSPRIKHIQKGLISMVNNGSGMHGSQFVLTLAENLDYLDNKHTVFGEVAEGFDVLDKLNKTFCDDDFRPHQDIRIYHTVILDDPYDDPNGLDIPAESPGPTQEMLDSDRIACDADIHEDEGKTEAELAEMKAEREAKANTQILEMVGDLPDMEIAPPENVLFVCKLNPVTTSEDLEIIFSRFGTIVSCEIIKDSKTGESLQYAFIEFENKEQCENAYFKMDNVLIDDRRIHVDFSQSVSKIKWKGKGRGVDILPTGNAPSYILKNQQRQSDGYDLVFENDALGAVNSDKGKKDQPDKRQKKTNRSRSRSPIARDNRGGKHQSDRRNRGEDNRGRNERGGDRRRPGVHDERRNREDRREDDRGDYRDRREDYGERRGDYRDKRGDNREDYRDRREDQRGRRGDSRDRIEHRRVRSRSRSPDHRNKRNNRRSESRERTQRNRSGSMERRERNRSVSRERLQSRKEKPSEHKRQREKGDDSRDRMRKRDRSESEDRMDRKRSAGKEKSSNRKPQSASSDDTERSRSVEKKTKSTRRNDSPEVNAIKNSKKKKSKKKSKDPSPPPKSEEVMESSAGDESESESERKKKKHKKKKRPSSSEASEEEEIRIKEKSKDKKKKKKKKNAKRNETSDEAEDSDSESERRIEKEKEKSGKTAKHHKKSSKHKSKR